MVHPLVKKKYSEAICFALNSFWKGKAEVSIINDQVLLFLVRYKKDFDARSEFESLGIDYYRPQQRWSAFEYENDFFVDKNTWEKICDRWKEMNNKHLNNSI